MTGAMLSEIPRMTVDQFLNWDSTGYVGKLELVHGEVRAMSPASGTHSLIQANLTGLIWRYLTETKQRCRVGTEAPIVPRLHANDNVRAPDLAVTCSTEQGGKLFPDPVLIIEVLSPSNKRETWESILACATIPTLAEIVVVDSERIHVEIYRRHPQTGWPVDPDVVATAMTVEFASIGLIVTVADIYAGTHLA
jgi:Uma2 family endonuclease